MLPDLSLKFKTFQMITVLQLVVVPKTASNQTLYNSQQGFKQTLHWARLSRLRWERHGMLQKTSSILILVHFIPKFIDTVLESYIVLYRQQPLVSGFHRESLVFWVIHPSSRILFYSSETKSCTRLIHRSFYKCLTSEKNLS